MNKSIALATALGLMAVAGATAPASADGFIAGALRDAGIINEDQRRALDLTHEQMGKPLDRAGAEAAGAAADIVVPGSGAVIRQQILRHAFPGFGR